MHRSSASRLSVSIVSLVSVLLLGAGNVLLGADAPKKTVKSTVFHAVPGRCITAPAHTQDFGADAARHAACDAGQASAAFHQDGQAPS